MITDSIYAEEQRNQKSIHDSITRGNQMGEAACQRQESHPKVAVIIDVPAQFTFGDALGYVTHQSGIVRRATRHGWNAPGQFIEAQYPDHSSKMGAPYLVLFNAQGRRVPWVPSQGDLFARDWALLPA